MKEIRLNIPEGCKAVTVKVDGGKVITEFEPKEEKWKPKDGDFYSIDNADNTTSTAIYNGKYTPRYGGLVPFHCGICITGELIMNVPQRTTGFGRINEIRPATEEEKQRLFDVLAKEGYRWNAEKNELEELPRWRADEEGTYYWICGDLSIEKDSDERTDYDSGQYSIGNYFRTREAAERVAEQIREIFKDSKAE